jgi:hypothetical protein
MIKIELINQVPYDIIINNIIPYLYIPQSKKLLEDIKDFYITYSEIKDYYSVHFNYFIMYNDISNFLHNNNKFYKTIKRHYIFSNFEYVTIGNYIYIKYNKINRKPKNKCKFLWSLLTPEERKIFIKYNLSK